MLGKATMLAQAAAPKIAQIEAAAEKATSAGDKIIKAFQPLIDVITAAAYPIAALMIATSFMLIIIGQRQRGMQTMKYAGIGYVGMQFLPALMGLLREVAKAMNTP